MPYYVYITTNTTGSVLYTAMTNNLLRRIEEHRKATTGFVARYNATCLVYFEEGPNVNGAIEREKQIKQWSRQKKLDLIGSMNPDWRDLYEVLMAP